MPTLILLDVSMSMNRRLAACDSGAGGGGGEGTSLLQTAVAGVKWLLRHIAQHCQLEYATVVIYSSMYESLSPFTRSFDSLFARLDSLTEYDKTSVQVALSAANDIIRDEWTGSTSCQVVLVSDGGVCCDGAGPAGLLEAVAALGGGCLAHCRLDTLLLADGALLQRHLVSEMYQKIIDTVAATGSVYTLDGAPSAANIEALFKSYSEQVFRPFNATLHVGCLNCSVSLCPSPQVTCASGNRDGLQYQVGDEFKVLGFITIAEAGNPPALSKHLVLPSVSGETNSSAVQEALQSTPSLCVLLHSALKQSGSVAVVSVGDDWFAIVYSWCDVKKKCNLFLSLLQPGKCPVPWLGDLSQLVSVAADKMASELPLKSAMKRSYQQSCVAWTKQSGIHSDVQKILRHARRLPDKTASFYKELNRLRCSALALGFHEVLASVAQILERECTMLPGDAHPDCALQLSHAAHALQLPEHRQQHSAIQPLWTRYH